MLIILYKIFLLIQLVICYYILLKIKIFALILKLYPYKLIYVLFS